MRARQRWNRRQTAIESLEERVVLSSGTGTAGVSGLISTIDNQLSQLTQTIKNQQLPPMASSVVSQQVSDAQNTLEGLAQELGAAISQSSSQTVSFASLDANLATQDLNLAKLDALNVMGAIQVTGGNSTTTPPSSQVVNQVSQAFDQATNAISQAFLNFSSSTGTGTGNGGSTSQNVTTYHNNQSRTGLYSNETTLTPQNVNQQDFGKLGSYKVKGKVFAQPLYLSNVNMGNGQTKNVLYVATEHDQVYAFNADKPGSAPLWHVSFLNASKGLTTIKPEMDEFEKDILPEVGITATPVIDQATNTIFVEDWVAKTGGGPTHFIHELHALDLTTGQEKTGSPVTVGDTTVDPNTGAFHSQTNVTVPGIGSNNDYGTVKFNAARQNERAGLVLDTKIPNHPGGVVFLSYGGLSENAPYHGWVVGFDAKTMQLYSVFNTTPDGVRGGLWASGGAPAVDSQGNLLMTTGDGSFDAYTSNTPPGPNAIGNSGRALGYGGIPNSVAVAFMQNQPAGNHSVTGLYYNGDAPTLKAPSPDVSVNMDGSGINFVQGGVRFSRKAPTRTRPPSVTTARPRCCTRRSLT